jgi:hypothetical protein
MRKTTARWLPEEKGDAENNDVSVRVRGNEYFDAALGMSRYYGSDYT